MLIIVIVYILRRIFGCTDGFFDALDFWTCTDSGHYLDIARDWYLSEGSVDRLVQLVFLPGYPVAVRLVTAVTGDGLIAGLIVSALCFAGANVMLYKLVSLDCGHETALRAVKFLSLSPAVFFFAAPMSESLFLLCTLGCMYLVRRGKMLPACLLGAYAAFTRSLGVVLIVPVVFELVQRRAKLKDYLCVLIIPLGFAAYCLVNYTVSGDAFKFMQYQREHWNQQLGWFLQYRCVSDRKRHIQRFRQRRQLFRPVAAEFACAGAVAGAHAFCGQKTSQLVHGVFSRILHRCRRCDLAFERTTLPCGGIHRADSACGYNSRPAS